MTYKELSSRIIGAAIEVHRELGPGLLEGVYERCLVIVLLEKGLHVEQQVAVPIRFRGKDLGANLRLDLIVDGRIVIEVKAIEAIHDSHKAQTLTYLKMTGCKLGLVINFGQRLLKEGVERVVNGLDEA
jgi:GxxExxY protein